MVFASSSFSHSSNSNLLRELLGEKKLCFLAEEQSVASTRHVVYLINFHVIAEECTMCAPQVSLPLFLRYTCIQYMYFILHAVFFPGQDARWLTTQIKTDTHKNKCSY